MKITTLTFEKRWNLGDYNHENLCATAGVEEGENPSTALKDLIAFVRTKGAEEVPAATQAAPPAQQTSTATEAKTVKEKKEKKTTAKAEEKQADTAGKDESNGNEKVSEKENAEVKSEVSEEKKPETKKVVSKGKGVPYDPNNNLHKKLVGEFLDKAQPSWRANTAPAKAVSQTLSGVEFQDAEGLIMEEFKAKFLEELKNQKA